jgi:hypothetical protein
MSPQPVTRGIREVLLQEIQAQQPKNEIDAPLSQNSVLTAAARRLSGGNDEAILTQWGELFRTGLLAWGLNLSNPGPPHFHLTDPGRRLLATLTRDPSNPDGYMRHLESVTKVNDVAMSYLREGLDCYVAGYYKAAAVMVGCAGESVILELRDATVATLKALRRTPSTQMNDWRIKTVTDELGKFFDTHKQSFDQKLKNSFEASWSTLAYQIRSVRNDAGHPTSIDPVTPDTVHAALLIFPELASLSSRLSGWIANELR